MKIWKMDLVYASEEKINLLLSSDIGPEQLFDPMAYCTNQESGEDDMLKKVWNGKTNHSQKEVDKIESYNT